MKTTLVMLICLMGLSTVRCACGKGTLHCTAEDKPTICDFTINYVMNEAKDGCEEKTVDGCKYINPEYTASNPCLMCEPGKVMDADNKKCVDVVSDKKKENCATYNKTDSSCESCDAKFYLSGGNCAAVTGEVDNCSSYSSATECSVCSSGYYLKDKKCEKITAVDNCYSHTVNRCDACSADYFLNRGLNSSITVNSGLKSALAMGTQSMVMMTSTNSNTVCEKKNSKNCATFETYNTCSACSTGYMVTPEKGCVHYPEDPIANCSKYSTMTTCVECTNAEYYLLNNKCEARTKKDDNCETYDIGKDECAKCKSTHYLDTEKKCTVRNPATYKNCATSQDDKNECKTCNEGYTLTGDKQACLSNPVNCATPSYAAANDATKHTCTKCLDGFTLADNVCGGAKISGCQEHEENKSECKKCDTGKYLENVTTCSAQNQANCQTHTTNENKCSTCDSLFSPDNNGACVSIGKANCYSSDGKTNECKVCKAGFYLNTTSKDCDARTQTPNKCMNNISPDTDDTKCNECEADYIKVVGAKPIITQATLTPKNCRSLLASSGFCNQCADNYFLSAEDTCTAPPNNTKVNCVRQNPGTTPYKTDLTQTTDCEVCNSARGYYSNSGTCTDLPLSNLFNCATPASGNEPCKACASGTVLIKNNFYTCASNSTDDRLTFLPNCDVQVSATKCYKCNSTNMLSGNTCSTKDATAVENTLDWVGAPTGHISYTGSVGQCKTYAQMNGKNYGCVVCNDNYVGIVDTAVTGHTGGSASPATLKRIPMSMALGPNHTTYNPFLKCIAKADVLGNNVKFTNSNASDNDCAVGITLDVSALSGTDESTVKDRYVCIQCITGKTGTIGKITGSSNTDTYTLANAIYGIKSCAANAAEHTDGTGVGYSKRFDYTMISYNHIFRKVSCGTDEATKIPLYEVQINTGNTLPFKYMKDNSAVVTCTARGDINFEKMDSTHANCAIAIRENGAAADSTFATNDKAYCVACKAKHKASYDSDGFLNKCEEITGCNASTGLGTCTEPDANKPLMATLDSSYYVVDFDTVATTEIADCSVAATSGLDLLCLVCVPGKTPSIDQKSCIGFSADNMTGSTDGMGQTALPHPGLSPTTDDMDSMTKQFQTVMQVRRALSNFSTLAGYKSVLGNGCANASDIYYYLPVSGADTDKICGKNVRSPAYVVANLCATPGLDGGCAVCSDPSLQIPSSDSEKCLLKSAKANCTMVGASDNCTACEAGYVLENHACVLSNCKLHNADKSKCLVCNDRCRANTGNDPKTRCKAAVAEDSAIDCLNFEGTDGKCVKCSDSNKIPYNYKLTYANGTKQFWSCETWARDGNGEVAYKNEPYTYLDVVVNTGVDPDTMVSTVTYLAEAGWANRQVDDYSKGGKSSENNCIAKRTVANCKNYKDFLCSSCDNGFALAADENKCEALTDTNCLYGDTYDKAVCDTCKTGFWANNGSCTARTPNQNCKDFNRINDYCSSCVIGERYLDITGGNTCKEYTAKNCLAYEEEANRCQTCNTSSYSFGSGSTFECKNPTPVDNCKDYSTSEDACTSCNTGYYEKTVNTKLTCEKLTTVDQCSEYETASDACKTCNDNYYYNSTVNECRNYPDGISNCAVYTHPKTCVSCKANHFLNSNACTAVDPPLAGCAVHKSATVCETCSTNYVKNGDICDAVTPKTGCIEYSDKDTCKACSPVYFLESGSCVNSNIAGCIEPVKGSTSNTCNKCESNRYLSDNKDACTLGTIVGCVAYESKDKCTLCTTAKILSADGSKCDSLTTQAGSECSTASTLAEPMCDVCKYGYKKDAEGKCVAIAAADCVTEDSDGKCLICQPNHSMDKDGKCKTNVEPEDPDKSVQVIKFWMTMFLATILLRFF